MHMSNETKIIIMCMNCVIKGYLSMVQMARAQSMCIFGSPIQTTIHVVYVEQPTAIKLVES